MKYRIDELDPEFSVKTVPEMGWASLSNCDLLTEAEKEFDGFVTSDKNLSFQQSIPSSFIQVILLNAITNTYEGLYPLVQKLSPAIKNHEKGSFVIIE